MDYLTNMYNIALNTNTIPHPRKHAIIIPIPKPNKNHGLGTNYQPTVKTLEKNLLPYIAESISDSGLKYKHQTQTALINLCFTYTTCASHYLRGFKSLTIQNLESALLPCLS